VSRIDVVTSAGDFAIHIPSQAKSVCLAYTTNESVVHIHTYYLGVIVESLWHSPSDGAIQRAIQRAIQALRRDHKVW